jgi:hypothetical protein
VRSAIGFSSPFLDETPGLAGGSWRKSQANYISIMCFLFGAIVIVADAPSACPAVCDRAECRFELGIAMR